ncbi:MAG: hypothetical protein V3V82_00860, partial [Acidimicrobiia bacterium]
MAPSIDELLKDFDRDEAPAPLVSHRLIRPPARARLPRWAVALATAFVVLLIVGGAAVVSQLGRESPVVTEPTLPTIVPPEVTTVTTVPDPSGDGPVGASGDLVWERVSTDVFSDSGADQDLTGVAVAFGDGRYVAVGSVLEAGYEFPPLVDAGSTQVAPRDAAVWVSEDGEFWSRVPHDEGVFGGEGARAMKKVIFAAGQFLAVGEELADGDLSIWVSGDGLTWTRVADENGALGGDTRFGFEVVDVTFGDAGYVVIGKQFTTEQHQVAWVSPDGLTWERVRIESTDTLQVQRAVSFGDAGYVVVGNTRPSPLAAFVIVSSDGLEWSLAGDTELWGDPPDGVLAYTPMDVSFEDGRYVSVGWMQTVTGPHAAVWVSSDALQWTLAYQDQDPRDRTSMEVVTHGAFGYVALGSRGIGANSDDIKVWASPDGLEWRLMEVDSAVFGGLGGQSIRGAVSGESGYVVVGGESTN